MYLSRVEMDIQNRRKMRDLSHLGAFHNWVEGSFPNEKDAGIRTRKLWRVDSISGKYFLLLVSEDKPDLKCLERYGISGSAETKSYDGFLQLLESGKQMKFRVALNPVKSVKDENFSKRGRVYPLLNDGDLMKFLLERSDKNGFHTDEDKFMIVEKGFEVLKKHNKAPLKLRKAVYEGELIISDIDAFRLTLTRGIGKKKAYGFGMMTVIPIVR
jgi:CRISPR system Cascade subunit CasE